MSLVDEIVAYAKKQYDAVSDRPWKRYPDFQTIRHKDYGLNVRWLMKLQLEHKYDPADFTIAVLRNYGVSYVRGPRSMPKELVDDLNR